MFLKRRAVSTIIVFGLLASIGFVACQPKLAPQTDCNFVMSSQIQRVSWKTNTPIKLYISSSVPEELRESVRIAASQWNYKLGKDVLIVLESDNVPQSPAEDGVNGIYFMNTWDSSRHDEQARTTIHWKGDLINEADILVNAYNHTFSAFGHLDNTKVDFTSLMVHEMGHVLGLQHIQGVESVMNPTLQLHKERYIPYPVDVKSSKCEYN